MTAKQTKNRKGLYTMYYFKSGVNTGALLNNMYNRRISDQSTFEPLDKYAPHIKAEEAYTAIESEIDNGTISESGKDLIRRLLEAYEQRIDIEYAYFYRLGVWDGYCLGLQDGSAFSKPEFLTEELQHAENSAQ